jgi:hypothetical protein
LTAKKHKHKQKGLIQSLFSLTSNNF